MTLYGTYPFLVYVANTFAPDSDVIYKVKCYRFLFYYDYETKNTIIETSAATQKVHSIEAGDRLAFPLYFGGEYLEISMEGTPGYDYQIVVGRKAKCYPDNVLKAPLEGTYKDLLGENDRPKGTTGPYGGGIWNVSKDEKDWKLIIKKYGADPESDDVAIGPPPPA